MTTQAITSERFVLGADCPHCEGFAPAFSTGEARGCQMYCRCGVVFRTKQTYCKPSVELTDDDWSHLQTVTSGLKRYRAKPVLKPKELLD